MRSTLTLFSLYWVSFFIALGQFLPFFSLYWVICPFSHCIGSFCPLFIILGQFLPFFSLHWVVCPFFIILGHFALSSLYWASFYPFSHYIGSFCPFFISLGQFYPFSGYIEDFVLPRYISMTDFINCSCEMVRLQKFLH